MKDETKKPSVKEAKPKAPLPPPQKKKVEPSQTKVASEGKNTPAAAPDSKAKKSKPAETPALPGGPKRNDTPTQATGERRSSRVRYFPEPDPVTATITSRAGKKKRKLDSGEGKTVEK
mmetsp:Transcript_8531/g.13156  ORF Transcript_8531/g.13156 Transcript_8531/m.13156 type:complete len:118 (-) Transcript_8531:17-370(-)